ncbi:MAG: CoA-binding protein [Firmicutes bacterium]|uniref:CoA-binding protein n=1 Tax=Sulfobacillus benefaciens TaxID=453960 RepID=A0A2T2XAE7_9FIRM|nr:CoA-binding protein [Bacillota bacterium]MCL5015556.1 CoA-binding protein [Bacillota bacterium]PSR31416.1 MAG: CoA-binding protein [Sulfobacillus benefaciens]HBQ94503.1 CoA-binding protein [Sulfobacillus sp.]
MHDEEIRQILDEYHHVAVVGLSPKEDRPSYEVSKFLQEHGFHIVPVHPRAETILGEKVYHRLEDIPFPVDIVDVFRRPEDTPDVAESAVRIGAKVLWLQLGIKNEVARSIAEAGGLRVIEDRCMKIEYARLFNHR